MEGVQRTATLPVPLAPLAPQPTQNHMADPAASTSSLCTWPLGVESENLGSQAQKTKKARPPEGQCNAGNSPLVSPP